MILTLDKESPTGLREASADELLMFMVNNPVQAYDIESTGLNTRKEAIIGFGISNSETGYYVVHQNYEKLKFPNMEEMGMCTYMSKEDCVLLLARVRQANIITWNGSFDLRFTQNFFGVDLVSSLWIEGMLAKHTVDEERPFRLKEVGTKLYGDDATKEQAEMKASIKANGGSVNEYYKADLFITAKYCIQDCILTHRISHHYLQKIKEEGLEDFFFTDEVMPLYKEVTIPMEFYGVNVDVPALKAAQKRIENDIQQVESDIQSAILPHLELFTDWFLNKDYPPKRTGPFAQMICSHYELDLPKTNSGKFSLAKKNVESLPESPARTFLLGGAYLNKDTVKTIQYLLWRDDAETQYMFNLSSKHHLKKLFFATLEETPISKTKKGNPQVDDKFLDTMATKYSWAEKLRVFNKLNKLKGSYIDRILDNQENGIFYPAFFQHRTISGRYGSDLQQLPRPKEDGELDALVLTYNNEVRKFFISGENHVFIDADYESLEPHVFAHVSNDEGLREIFRSGHDFYSTIAIKSEQLSGVSADKKAENYLGKLNKPKRQNAKPYALGIPYGMEAFKLHHELKISKDAAQQIIDGYLSAFPNLHAWMIETDQKVLTQGNVRSQAGRVRHMPMAPKIWAGHSKYILNSLEIWKKYHEHPAKYEQIKYLRKTLRNYLNNGRNFQIQSLAASITNRACINIARSIRTQSTNRNENILSGEYTGHVCAQIHDQIITRVPKETATESCNTVERLMENSYSISLPLKAPAVIAKDFYEGH